MYLANLHVEIINVSGSNFVYYQNVILPHLYILIA